MPIYRVAIHLFFTLRIALGNNIPCNAIHRLQQGGLHLFMHAISPFPCHCDAICRARDKNAIPNELPARALIARARARGALGALEGRIRLSYIHLGGAGKRNRASGGRWASCCSLRIASIYWRLRGECAICERRSMPPAMFWFTISSRNANDLSARGEELCAREIESIRVLCMNL